MCRSMDDVEDVIEPLLSYIGLHVSREPLFLTKLLRLGRMQLSSTVSDGSDSVLWLLINA